MMEIRRRVNGGRKTEDRKTENGKYGETIRIEVTLPNSTSSTNKRIYQLTNKLIN